MQYEQLDRASRIRSASPEKLTEKQQHIPTPVPSSRCDNEIKRTRRRATRLAAPTIEADP